MLDKMRLFPGFVFVCWLSCFAAILCPFVTKDSLLNVKGGNTSPGGPVTMSDCVGQGVGTPLDLREAPPCLEMTLRGLQKPTLSHLPPSHGFFHLEGAPPRGLLASLHRRWSVCPDWWAQEEAPSLKASVPLSVPSCCKFGRGRPPSGRLCGDPALSVKG